MIQSISIIIPNYNGSNLLKRNLPQVIIAVDAFKKKYTSTIEIIICDDGSFDDSVKTIEELSKGTHGISIKSILHKKNHGFSSNVNSGVEAASGEVVVLLNTDVYPQEDFLSPLLSHFDHEGVVAVGCMDKSIEDGKTVLRGRGIGQWKKGFLIHTAGSIEGKLTLWASGGSSAFRRSYWKKLGGLYSIYNPFYWEDIDLCYRAWKSGYTIMFEPKSIVVHEHEEGAIRSQNSASKIKIIAYRNQFIFVWLNITDRNYLQNHIGMLPYLVLRSILKFDIAFIYGLFLAFILLPKIVQLRHNNKKYFIKTDKEVLSHFLSDFSN